MIIHGNTFKNTIYTLVWCQQATNLQSRYIELLTRSGDYYKFLGELLKNMEELKVNCVFCFPWIWLDLLSSKLILCCLSLDQEH